MPVVTEDQGDDSLRGVAVAGPSNSRPGSLGKTRGRLEKILPGAGNCLLIEPCNGRASNTPRKEPIACGKESDICLTDQ